MSRPPECPAPTPPTSSAAWPAVTGYPTPCTAPIPSPATGCLRRRYDKVGNILVSRLAGADVRLVPAEFGIGIKKSWEQALREIEESGGPPYAIPAGASDHPLGGLGFAGWAFEVAGQEHELGVFFDTIVVRCGICGRLAESCWSNGRPAYRCRHGHSSASAPDPGRPRNLYIREDRILAHLPALHVLLTGAGLAAGRRRRRTRHGADMKRPTSEEDVIGYLRVRQISFTYHPATGTLQADTAEDAKAVIGPAS